MGYRYLDTIATADVAFEAWAATLEELFTETADALVKVMIDNLDSILPKRCITILTDDESEEMLLFRTLQELIYFKDAEGLLLLLRDVHIERSGQLLRLSAQGRGEEVDPARHEVSVDVKAVTMHRFSVTRTDTQWRATVVLDI